MKLIFELSLIVIFFIAFKLFGIYPAIGTAMALYSGQILYQILARKPIENLQWVTLGMVLILGGASLFFHNDLFFKWKPSVIYLIFASAILMVPLFTKAPALQKIMGQQLDLPPAIWRKLDYSWALFFILCAILNLIIAYQFETETWVYFKLFGSLAMIMVFIIGQAIWLSPYLKKEELK